LSEIYKGVDDYRRGIETGVMKSATPNVVRQLIEYLDDIHRDIKGIHQRKCWPCQKIHWHSDNSGRPVACPECGSYDTRLVRKPG
jgi:DNA-directed RNA polymerase subunit RPC12/RpoP